MGISSEKKYNLLVHSGTVLLPPFLISEEKDVAFLPNVKIVGPSLVTPSQGQVTSQGTPTRPFSVYAFTDKFSYNPREKVTIAGFIRAIVITPDPPYNFVGLRSPVGYIFLLRHISLIFRSLIHLGCHYTTKCQDKKRTQSALCRRLVLFRFLSLCQTART